MRTTPRRFELAHAAARLALHAAVMGLAVLLQGCATQSRVPAETPPKAVSKPAPPSVTTALTQRILVALAGRLSLTSDDLAASTHVEQLAGLSDDQSVYLSRTEGSQCTAGNCAYGLFIEERGRLRELYFGRLASAPRVMPERYLGFAELTTSEMVDDTQSRTVRLRWDGDDFVESSCLLVSRVTNESRPCAAFTHMQVVTEPRLPTTLCEQVKTLLSRPLTRIQTQTMMRNSYLVRGETNHHVEAIKVRGNVVTSAKRTLVTCARTRGTAELIDSAASPQASRTGDHPADIVRFRVRGAEVNAVDLAFGLAYFKRGDVTLVTVGVSAVAFSER